MPRWQYKIERYASHPSSDQLDVLGAEGWELVHLERWQHDHGRMWATFKRPVDTRPAVGVAPVAGSVRAGA